MICVSLSGSRRQRDRQMKVFVKRLLYRNEMDCSGLLFLWQGRPQGEERNSARPPKRSRCEACSCTLYVVHNESAGVWGVGNANQGSPRCSSTHLALAPWVGTFQVRRFEKTSYVVRIWIGCCFWYHMVVWYGGTYHHTVPYHTYTARCGKGWSSTCIIYIYHGRPGK